MAANIAAFALRVLLWGALLFAAWYYAAFPISVGVAGIAAKAAEAAGPVGRIAWRIPDRPVVFSVEPAGEYVLRDRLPANVVIDVPINPLKHTFGMPFFLALLLASRTKGLAWKAPLGLAIIGVLAGAGMAFELLLQLFPVTTPKGVPLFPFSGAAREAIAIGYQLGALILPTVVPVILWAAMDRGTALRIAGNEAGEAETVTPP